MKRKKVQSTKRFFHASSNIYTLNRMLLTKYLVFLIVTRLLGVIGVILH